MSLSDKMGRIGNASYFHPLNGEEPTNYYDEVLQVKDVREAVNALKLFIKNHTLGCGCCLDENKYDSDNPNVAMEKMINDIFGEKLI